MDSKSALSKQNIEAIYPLTPMQEGILFQTLSSGSWEYFQQMTYTLCGELNRAALKCAWEHVIAQHAVMRTLFKWERIEKPIQIVRRQVWLPWQEEDWRASGEDEQKERLNAFLIANRRLGFDLSKAPLTRMTLIQEAGDKHKFVWSYHHLLMDGWSAATVCNEVFTLYEAYCRGEKTELPRARPFRDYIIWLAQQDFSHAETYWRQKLKGFKAPTALGDIGKRFNLASNQEDYEQEGTMLNEGLLSAVQKFARQSHVTMNTVMIGVWALLLSRYSHQRDVLFGTVVSGRPPQLDGVEAMVGVFINTLPVRVEVKEEAALVEWLASLQAEQVQMQQYEYTPLVEIKRWSDVPAAQPLFESLLVFQNFPRDFSARQQNDNSERRALSAALAGDDTRNNYPLTLGIGPTPGSLLFLYDRRRFNGRDIDRMLNHIETLLGHFIKNPDDKLSALAPVLDEADRKQQLLKETNFKEARALRLKSVKRSGPVGNSRQAASMNEGIRKFASARRLGTRISQDQLVQIEFQQAGRRFLMVIQPAGEGIDLVAWACHNLAFIEKSLANYGAILFRDFQFQGVAYFEQFCRAIAGELLEYVYRSTPRSRVSGNIYTSTEYPADQSILLHNENSYALSWPMKILFFCEQPAERGGETPIADSRRVLRRLDPQIKKQFIRKKVMYIRNHGGALDLPWQTVFQTTDKAEVETYCRRANLDFQWRDGNRLRTQQICQAVAVHPFTREQVWFNQAHLFHPSSLKTEVREYLLSNYRAEDFPRYACYGDSSPIEDSVLDEIRQVYQEEETVFSWQKNSVLLLDNMLMAHGRTSFSGPRRILVAMADPCHAQET